MTTLKTIPKATVNGAIKLARLPATPCCGPPESVASSAGLAVDRADAVRSVAGTALRDEKLRAEAKRLRQAVAARRRALGLRERARERTKQARSRPRRHVPRPRSAESWPISRPSASASRPASAASKGRRRPRRPRRSASRPRSACRAAGQGHRAGTGWTRRCARGQGRRTLEERARANRDRRGAAAQGCCRAAKQERKEATARTPGPGSMGDS